MHLSVQTLLRTILELCSICQTTPEHKQGRSAQKMKRAQPYIKLTVRSMYSAQHYVELYINRSAVSQLSKMCYCLNMRMQRNHETFCMGCNHKPSLWAESPELCTANQLNALTHNHTIPKRMVWQKLRQGGEAHQRTGL